MNIQHVWGDEGSAYYVKGHVLFNEFMDAVKLYIGDYDCDSILKQEPVHCWMRTVRDFQEECTVFCEAVPNSRGAFKATWIQED